MEGYLSNAVIPLLLTVILGYYSFRMLVLKDIGCVRGKDSKKVKDEEMYLKTGGKLMAFLSAASLAMALLSFVSALAAVLQMAVCVVIFGILWKRMHEKYGD